MLLHYSTSCIPVVIRGNDWLIFAESRQLKMVKNLSNDPAKHFKLVRQQHINTLKIDLAEYRHPATGARHFHIDAEDNNNVFMMAFPTMPEDSTGVAHILEHTVLCGSRKYPVRDPFFMMLRRSLNTFMNAFTGSDYTAYPFATCNHKDFENLLSVYLDAAFFPILNTLDFAQEGHRLEFSKPDDAGTSLVYRGVVYNEMKGAMSAPTSRLWQALQSHIYPTTTYHYNSGGEPETIPELTHEALRAFHARHYHPSNATFMTYGTIPAAEHQQNFQSQVLEHFESLNSNISNRDEERFTEPQQAQISYALDPAETAEHKTHIIIGWLLDHSFDLDALMEAALLVGVLLDNSSSPLRHALETSRLGSSPSELCGVEESFRQMLFVCGIEGSDPEHTAALEKLVFDTLTEIAEQGVAEQQLEAVLQQIELEQRQARSGEPYGLQVMGRLLPTIIHGGDPFVMLDLDPVLEQMRQKIRDPDLIPRLIREKLLDNPHRVLLTMEPDQSQSQHEQQTLEAKLADIKKALTATETSQLLKQAADLNERQRQEDDTDVLPKVGLNDVPSDLPSPTFERQNLGDIPTCIYAVGSNGLVHEQLVLPLTDFTTEELDALPLYGDFLTEFGCADDDYLTTQMRQSLAGNVDASVIIRADTRDKSQINGWFTVSGLSLNRQHQALSELLRDHLFAPRLDESKRLRELLAQANAAAEGNVTASGHTLAMAAASAGLSSTAALNHRWHGLQGIQLLKQLNQRANNETALQELLGLFTQIQQKLLQAPLQILLVCEADKTESMCKLLANELKQNGSSDYQPFAPKFTPQRKLEAWSVNTQVNFCARAYEAVSAQHNDAASLMVLGKVLTNGFLHGAIREQGGAYGGGASYDPDAGAMRFFSYRDPRLVETLDDFDHSLDWLQSGGPDARQLEEAILGIIGAIDRPDPPVSTAIRDYHQRLQGRGPDYRKNLRQRILDVSLQDLYRVAEKYLQHAQANTVVISDAATLDNIDNMNWQVLTI